MNTLFSGGTGISCAGKILIFYTISDIVLSLSMVKEKYTIISGRKIEEDSEQDASITSEPSSILLGTKYPEAKTKFVFNFLETSLQNIVKSFLITIFDAKKGGIFYGFDASENCIVVSSVRLDTGRRYRIYGRLKRDAIKIVYCLKAEEILYKTLCYEVF